MIISEIVKSSAEKIFQEARIKHCHGYNLDFYRKISSFAYQM